MNSNIHQYSAKWVFDKSPFFQSDRYYHIFSLYSLINWILNDPYMPEPYWCCHCSFPEFEFRKNSSWRKCLFERRHKIFNLYILNFVCSMNIQLCIPWMEISNMQILNGYFISSWISLYAECLELFKTLLIFCNKGKRGGGKL